MKKEEKSRRAKEEKKNLIVRKRMWKQFEQEALEQKEVGDKKRSMKITAVTLTTSLNFHSVDAVLTVTLFSTSVVARILQNDIP